jgi:hypothetical protein
LKEKTCWLVNLEPCAETVLSSSSLVQGPKHTSLQMCCFADKQRDVFCSEADTGGIQHETIQSEHQNTTQWIVNKF